MENQSKTAKCEQLSLCESHGTVEQESGPSVMPEATNGVVVASLLDLARKGSNILSQKIEAVSTALGGSLVRGQSKSLLFDEDSRKKSTEQNYIFRSLTYYVNLLSVHDLII